MKPDKKYGWYDSEADYLSYFKGTLIDDEPIGFFACVGDAIRTFKLSGPARIRFVAACVRKLLQLGAVTCIPGSPEYNHDWVSTDAYGTKSGDIYRNVLNEWIEAGASAVPPWTGVWFGLPSQVTPVEKAEFIPPEKRRR